MPAVIVVRRGPVPAAVLVFQGGSLGIVDPDVEVGTEVKLIWGEPDGGTEKLSVERHKQLEIRATVSTVPYSAVVREGYHGHAGWRKEG